MSGWQAYAPSPAGAPHQWQVESCSTDDPTNRVFSAWRVAVLGAGLLLTLAMVGAIWLTLRPPTLVQTRITADTAGPEGRAALAEAALRVGASPGRTATLDAFGDALVVAVSDDDAAIARTNARSTADMVLNMATVSRQTPLRTRASPEPSRPDPGSAQRAALLASRLRLQAEMDGVDGRMSAVSASMTGIARDIAAGARALADHKPGHETLDKATVALADLQLQRIQMQTRYQDDYPAVVALDGQIRSLRSFTQDEQRRFDMAARTGGDLTDPVLGGERDRLRAELAQLTDRRAATANELANVTRALSSPVPDHPAPRPQPVMADSPPPPILIEGATTVTSGTDPRWIAVPAVAAVGAMLSLLLWFMPRRAHRSVRTELLLQHLEALLLPPDATASLPFGSYTALTRDHAINLLRSSAPVRGLGGLQRRRA